ncbi:hypothetical protein D3C71_875340 [compost metagenome]
MRITSSGCELARSKVVLPTYEVSRRPWAVPRLGLGADWRAMALADDSAAMSALPAGGAALARASPIDDGAGGASLRRSRLLLLYSSRDG